jgi:rhodanese-related sulfurtransferase
MSMSNKLQDNIFHKLNKVMDRLDSIEKRIDELEDKLDTSLAVQRCHIMRIKNGEELADEYVLNGHGYNDVDPEMAWKIYQQKDYDYILLDVSAKDYTPERELPEATKIPLEELNIRYREIVNKATTVLVISEDGTRSIAACEILNDKGYYNVNNVSGGYKFWPGFRLKEVPLDEQESA